MVDAYESEIRKLLRDYPTMPATVIAERIGFTHSLTVLKDRLRVIRPEYVGVDPADRLVHEPGQVAQMDLWLPEPRTPTGMGNVLMFPVLVSEVDVLTVPDCGDAAIAAVRGYAG
nr:hypothetical protein GCM10023233_32980 [Brevibacterium otitidis]